MTGVVVVVGGGAVVARGAVVVGALVTAAVVACGGAVVVAAAVVVGVAPYAPLYWYLPRQLVHSGFEVGSGNGTSWRRAVAACMYRCQIDAGKVGPETAMPCTSSIGISPRG